jgi:hypothetical protein
MTAQPLYRYYKIEVDLSNLTANVSAGDDSGRKEASDADNMELINVEEFCEWQQSLPGEPPRPMSTFIIVNLNVQSLQAHVGELQTEELIPKADIIVLTETWLRDPHSIDDSKQRWYNCIL